MAARTTAHSDPPEKHINIDTEDSSDEYFSVASWKCFPGGTVLKNPPANMGEAGCAPGWGRWPGEGNGNPLQYSCLENSMDRSLAGCSPQGCKESDTTERLNNNKAYWKRLLFWAFTNRGVKFQVALLWNSVYFLKYFKVFFFKPLLCFHIYWEKVKVKSRSHVQLFATPWTVAHQAPPSMGFSRQEYWSGLPFLSPGIFPTQGSNPGLLHCRQTL